MEAEAYRYWRISEYLHARTESELQPFMALKPGGPWLKKMREATYLSTREMARRLRISGAGYSKMENREDTLSVARLRECARALNCELVYALVPGKMPSRVIWEAICPLVAGKPIVRSAIHPHRALAALVRDKMYDPEFRKMMGWAKNNTPKAYPAARARKDERDFSRYGV